MGLADRRGREPFDPFLVLGFRPVLELEGVAPFVEDGEEGGTEIAFVVIRRDASVISR